MTKRQDEFAEQVQFVRWVRSIAPKFEPFHWLHSSLNGVDLTMPQAVRMKQAGMVAGIPDLFFPLPSKTKHGLFIEMKTHKGDLSHRQQQFKAYAESVGYVVAVAHDCVQAKQAVFDYLKED